jgi:hypothetical protein
VRVKEEKRRNINTQHRQHFILHKCELFLIFLLNEMKNDDKDEEKYKTTIQKKNIKKRSLDILKV